MGRPAAPGAPARRTRSTVALVGKYVDLPDAYLSVTEALRAGGFANDAKVDMRWVASDDCADARGRRARSSPASTRVCVPGGFGVRGIEGKLGALALRPRAPASRRSGLCLGLQCMVIEYARNVAGLDGRRLDRVRPATRRTR